MEEYPSQKGLSESESLYWKIVRFQLRNITFVIHGEILRLC